MEVEITKEESPTYPDMISLSISYNGHQWQTLMIREPKEELRIITKAIDHFIFHNEEIKK